MRELLALQPDGSYRAIPDSRHPETSCQNLETPGASLAHMILESATGQSMDGQPLYVEVSDGGDQKPRINPVITVIYQ